MRQQMPVDEGFVKEAQKHGTPEARMRFASKCQTSGCSQWTGERCGVIDKVLGHLDAIQHELDDRLPACPIRATCRWFSQTGARACAACDLVTTDQTQIAAE